MVKLGLARRCYYVERRLRTPHIARRMIGRIGSKVKVKVSMSSLALTRKSLENTCELARGSAPLLLHCPGYVTLQSALRLKFTSLCGGP